MTYSPPTHIAVINRSRTLDDNEAVLWVEAYRQEIKRVADAWGLSAPGIAYYPPTFALEPDPNVAAIYVVDTAGDSNALGYHTAAGRARFGYVDMTLSRLYDNPSVVMGHELYELFVDADCARWAGPFPDGTHVPIEVCDPVERDSYTVEADFLGKRGVVAVADFVLPAWFSLDSRGPWAYRSPVMGPLQDNLGGYHVVERDGAVITGRARVKSFGRTFRRLAMGRPR